MSTDDSMHAENTTTARDNTADAYNELDRAETDLHIATEFLVAPGPFADRDQADAIRGWFEARDAHRAAVVEAVVQTNLFGEECSDAGLDLSEEIAEFTDRVLIDCVPEVPSVPEFWPPREGDVWADRGGFVCTVRGGVLVSEVGEEWPTDGFDGEGVVLLSRGVGRFCGCRCCGTGFRWGRG